MSAWRRLGIDRTADPTAIRKAYAKQLKAIDPETDPQGFIALRAALQAALGEAAARAAAAAEEAPAEAEMVWAEPEPQPEPAAVERAAPAPDLPQLDEEPLRRMQAILFGDSEEGPEALAEATAALLADPALEQVELSRQIEALLAQWIIEGSPRSDPIIDAASAFFRWDTAAGELRRAPALEWILHRREDRFFEADLRRTAQRPYHRLFRALKAPPKPMGAFTRWRLAPYASNLLAYCRQRHPSLLSGFHPETLAEWEQQFAALRSGKGLAARVSRLRRRDISVRGVLRAERPSPSPRLWMGVALLPFVCVWLLLRPGHSWFGRLVGFAWFAILLIIVANDQDEAQRSPAPVPSWNTLYYTTPQREIDPLLATLAPGNLTLDSLARNNPPLAARLTTMWHEASDNGTRVQDFDAAAGRLVEASYSAALRSGNYEIETSYWRVELEKLRWLLQARGASACDAYLGAGAHPGWPNDLYEKQAAMVAQAIVAGPADPPERPAAATGEQRKFVVPGPIFAAAAKRAGMTPESLSAALTGSGDQAQRCEARIALIEEALAQPRAAASPLLRRMSSAL